MKLNELPRQVLIRPKKRIGRGHGSGKGKTSGRGTKGQKARETISTSFEGGQLRLVKRLPTLRGTGNFAAAETLAVNVGDLATLPKGSRVNPDTLIEAGLISAADSKKRKIKILGEGEISTALKVELPVSNSAAKKIEAAGGTVLEENSRSRK
jgi:large subunit ribosomal protein L15